MINLILDSLRFTQPVVQSFDPAAKRALYMRTAALTTVAAVAWKGLRLLHSRPWNSTATLSSYFSISYLLGASLGAKAFSVCTIGLVALSFYKLEFKRGKEAFQHEIANRNSVTDANELSCLAENPSAVAVALQNPQLIRPLLFQAILDGNHFNSFKQYVEFLMSKGQTLAPFDLGLAVEKNCTACVAYALYTKGALPKLTNQDIVDLWDKTTTQEVAKQLKTHQLDINTKNERGFTVLTQLLKKANGMKRGDILNQVRLFIQHGAQLSLDTCSDQQLAWLRNQIGDDNELKNLFKNDPEVSKIFN